MTRFQLPRRERAGDVQHDAEVQALVEALWAERPADEPGAEGPWDD